MSSFELFRRVHRIATGFVVSVCPSGLKNSAATGRILMINEFFLFNLSRQFKFHSNLTIMTGNMKTICGFLSHVTHFFLKREISEAKVE